MDSLNEWFPIRQRGIYGFISRTPLALPNGYALSVQASEGHYCSPRAAMDDLHAYESVEMAVIDPEGELVEFDPRWWHYDTVASQVPLGDIPMILSMVRSL